MSFGQAIQTCWRKYADFGGRAARPEFWWFILFSSLVSAGVNALNLITPNGTIYIGGALAGVWSVAMLLPTLAVAVRRLRDTGRSWMELLWLLVPIAGLVIIVFLLTAPSQAGAPTQAPASPASA